MPIRLHCSGLYEKLFVESCKPGERDGLRFSILIGNKLLRWKFAKQFSARVNVNDCKNHEKKSDSPCHCRVGCGGLPECEPWRRQFKRPDAAQFPETGVANADVSAFAQYDK